MPDRLTLLSFVLGAVAFCTFGVFSLHHIEVVGTALAALSAVLVAAMIARAVRHRCLVYGLWSLSVPDRLAGVPVRTGNVGDAAFVAGLGRPTIFCDRQLPDQLSALELEAVVLHERAHQRAWDPARLLLLELAAPVVGRMPFGSQWLAWSFARREIAADRYAMDHGASRVTSPQRSCNCPRWRRRTWRGSPLRWTCVCARCSARTSRRPSPST